MSIAVLFLVAALAGGTTSERYQGRIVQRLELVQDEGAVPRAAQELLEVAPGDRYDAAAIRRSIKHLFALGTFRDIQVEAESEGEGVVLTFRLYPTVRVGEVLVAFPHENKDPWKGLRKALLEACGLRKGERFEAEPLEQSVEQMTERLQREGLLWSSVEPEVRFESGEATVIFQVTPGMRARLQALHVQGAPAHIAEHLRRQLRASPGEPYSRLELNEDIDETLGEWKRNGYYEASIHIREEPRPPELVEVTLDVDMGPRFRIEVEGVNLSERVLRRAIAVLREGSASADLVEESRGNLEEYFRDRGFRDTVVTVERLEVDAKRAVVLRFLVETGERFQIGEMRFEGLSFLTSEQALHLMKTRPGGIRTAPFRPRVWEEDLRQVRLYFRQQGFHRCSVYGEEEERSGQPRVLDLTAHVEEGPRALIETIDVEGAQEISSFEILSGAGLRAGTAYWAPALAEAREHVVALYRNKGFQEASVDISSSLDETGTRASVALRIREGAPTFVGRVIVSGADVTREEVLRREVAVTPQMPLSSEALLETRQRLLGTGLFRGAQVEALPVDPVNRSADVLVSVEEGPRTSFGYGFGYNEQELARVEGEITRRNLFGLNRSASVFARASIKGGRFIATYRQPEFVGLDVPVFFSAYYEDGERPGYDYIRRGLGLQFSKKISEHRTAFLRFDFNRTDVTRSEIDPSELPRPFRPFRLATVSISQVTDTRDDPITPSRGQFRLLDLELSAELLGSKSPYVKGLAQQFFYFPLPYRVVAVIGLRLGIGQTFRQDRDALLPITERFFAGGANTLRGFSLDQASPKDPLGNPVGGNVLTLANAELRFPITGKLGGVVFSDNGAVYRRLQVIELLNWRYNAGFGFRYDTPLGPLRVDWGFKIDRRPDEGRSRVHVSLGHAF